MLLKTGGGDESPGRAEGIHMHMALAGKVEYIATDDKLQNIPWIKITDENGNDLIYRSDGLATLVHLTLDARRLKLAYATPGLVPGAWISAVTLIAVLSILGWCRLRA